MASLTSRSTCSKSLCTFGSWTKAMLVARLTTKTSQYQLGYHLPSFTFNVCHSLCVFVVEMQCWWPSVIVLSECPVNDRMCFSCPSPPIDSIWAMMSGGKRGDYQNCSALYCVLKLRTVISTLWWTVLTVLWIRFCHIGPISLCIGALFVFYLRVLCVFLFHAAYTVNHKKRDILFLTITLANLNQFL